MIIGTSDSAEAELKKFQHSMFKWVKVQRLILTFMQFEAERYNNVNIDEKS